MFALEPWFFACWWEILLSFFWSRNFFSIFASESHHFVFSSIFVQKSTSNQFLGSYVCSRTVIFCMLVGNFLSSFWSRNFFSIFASESRHFVFSSIFAQKSTLNRFLGNYVCSRTVIISLWVGNFIIFILKLNFFSIFASESHHFVFSSYVLPKIHL